MNKPFYKLCLLSFLLGPLCLKVNAQVLTALQQTFNQYHQTAFQEKLYVHSDKDAYLTGELLWFKVYYLNQNSDQPADLSKVIYVDVLAADNSPVLQAKIALKEGSGNGSFAIPVTVLTGVYKLRAYTNWMKNFGPDVYFEKQITLINPADAPAKKQETKGNYSLQFFPEGGDLIEGITSKVAFKATGRDGKGIDLSGRIVNQQNETVAQFKTTKFGIGQFTFVPAANNSYKAIVNTLNDGTPVEKVLPAAKKQGYSLKVTDGGTGSVAVSINTNLPVKDNVYLLVYNGGKISMTESLSINGGTALFNADKSKLGDGISSFTVFNSSGQPVCERLYFKRPEKKLIIDASSSIVQYTSRQQVNVAILTKNETDQAQRADLSVSVYHLDSLQSATALDIVSYLYLGAELKGEIESPAYYFNTQNKEGDEALDNLLLTHGWRHFKWDNLINRQPPLLKFIPELKGPLINGSITDRNNQPIANNLIHMGIPGKRNQYYSAKSDSSGHFIFNTKNFYGLNEIVLQTNKEGDTTHKIALQSPFSEQFSATSFSGFEFTPSLLGAIQLHTLNTQVQNTYTANKLNQFYNPGVDSSSFYGIPSKTYNLNDYTRFPTIEEVLREYVSEVNIVRQQGHFHIKVINDTRFLGEEPLVLVDGVPYFDTDQLMRVDPLKIEKLEVVNNIYFWGTSKSGGILSFTSKKGDLNGIEIDPKAVVVDYEGLQLQREFYAPEYKTEEKKKSRIPDFRNQLYWSPSVETNQQGYKNLSFYTSDQPGTYIGVIQGITAAGVPGVKTFTFEVKK